ncbi:shikimate kinase [Garciella nitratireducens]|uniref:shikimate kinase n=1 Tax=Garciella nitratireducens TaxID=218205 RepID=UPI000DE9DD48|nr:shikimate kinase [Garciella nitratireducens]RBP40247.1 shikimate kinase [Garciella nitratireducens]
MKNKVLLIGMPGSGKTTLSRMLSKILQVPYIDMDDFIESQTGKEISQIFQNGEHYFRYVETQACNVLAKKKDLIIAAGGGIVKKPVNLKYFEQDTLILFINRPIEEIIKDIDLSTRPLLKSGMHKLELLYKERYSLYKKFSDYTIENVGDINKTLEEILKIMKDEKDIIDLFKGNKKRSEIYE